MKKAVLYLLILSVVVVLIYLVYSVPNWLRINKITCKSQYGSCNPAISKSIAEFQGKSVREAKAGIKKTFSDDSVENYLIRYVLPNDFAVEIVERKGMHAMQKDSGGEIFLINKDGKILSASNYSNLPVLKYSQGDFRKGDIVGEKYMFALRILFDMNYLYKVKKANLVEDSVYMAMDNVAVIFPVSGDKDALVGVLVLIYSQLKGPSENTRMKDMQEPLTIDMRYRNPVIRKGNSHE